MTSTTAQPVSALEQALAAFEDNLENRQAILKTLLRSRIFIAVDRPWDGKTRPDPATRLLMVSDGPNLEQPMLALFTDAARSEQFRNTDDPFKYSVEAAAPWAMLGVPAGAGIIINPNSAPNFRILPALAAELRSIAEQELARGMARDQVSRA